MGAARHVFAVPDLDGPVTGGTLFNRELVAALRARGEVVDVQPPPATSAAAWVDSLFLDLRPHRLLAHYLPSLVGLPEERMWFDRVEACVAPSPFLAEAVVARGVHPDRIGIVEPGVSDLARPRDRAPRPVTGVVIANLVPAKGVLPLLEALPRGPYRLRIVGSVEGEYAARCRAVAGPEVIFEGPVPHSRCLEILAESDVLLSASTMESYGMALAEARACGVPVLAREGGNVAHVVEASAGGEVLPDVRSIAAAFVRLAADPDARADRVDRARASVRIRTWAAAAADFSAFASGRV